MQSLGNDDLDDFDEVMDEYYEELEESAFESSGVDSGRSESIGYWESDGYGDGDGGA